MIPIQYSAEASEAVWSWRGQPPDAWGHVGVEALDWRSQRLRQ